MKIAASFRNKESRAGVIGIMLNNPGLQQKQPVSALTSLGLDLT
jgi:hypothetical protein